MKFITTYLSPVKWAFLSACLLSLIHVVSALTVPTLTASIINEGVLQGDLDAISRLSVAMLAASLVTVIGSLSAVYLAAHIASRVSLNLRQQLVQALQDFSLSDFSKYGTGTLLMRATRDVEKIQSVLAEGINMILPMPLMIIVGLGLTFYKSFEMGLIILSLMVIMVVLMISIQKQALPIVMAVQQQLDKLTDLVRDHIIGMSVIRAFNRTDDEKTAEIGTSYANSELSTPFTKGGNVPLLEFRNVTFRYDDAEEAALKDISFTLNAGETLAIMGDIGSGKSTLAKLILGLYPIECGDILFNGRSIFKQPIEQVRSQIGYVPQKAYLFTGTIAMNLEFGKSQASNAPLTREDIEEAAKLAGAHEFISRFEDGYEHELAQGGTNLSGGQRQRLAMARALIRKPRLLIFDDSFSALDGITEQQVRKAVAEEISNGNSTRTDKGNNRGNSAGLTSGRAFISIEQKVSAAQKADKILVINQGESMGVGTHEELLAHCPIYQQIVTSQEVAL